MIRRGLWKQPSAANASAMPNNIGFAEKPASGSRTEASLTLHFRQLLVPGHGNKRSQAGADVAAARMADRISSAAVAAGGRRQSLRKASRSEATTITSR